MEKQKEQAKPEQKLREFTEAEREWMEIALAVMPPKLAVRAFLDTHWEFLRDTEMPREEVERRVYQSFKQARYDKKRLSFAKIQAQIAEIQELFIKLAESTHS